MKRLNVLISSTRQWNPGDEFIRKGIQRILQSYLGEEHNWLLWNRNPDLFRTGASAGNRFVTNSLSDPNLDIMDIVVLAGTPEWLGPPLERVFRQLLSYPNLPTLVLGVGSGSELPQFEAFELEILSRPNTLVTTRNTELAAHINEKIGTQKAIALPCPALFCQPDKLPRPVAKRIGVIVQSSSIVNQSISEEIALSFIAALRKVEGKMSCEILGLYIDEFLRFSRLGFQFPCVYSYEPDDYLKHLAGCSFVISTRLHGALAALSACVPSILVTEEGNFRIRSAQALFGDLLPLRTVSEAFADAQRLSTEELARKSNDIAQFKANAFTQLNNIVSNFLDTHLLSTE